ncbi:MAG TPA: hypothetical protein DEO54_00470 [Rikenellaceae bacterium]|nr:MAG: hypothetical protein A2X20_01585 [Bacteroidetes bacterium GWE2_40_15]HBZ24696.1 hypothetical protein [Rikenellaceae bacterium]
MIFFTHYRNDSRQVFRDPVMRILIIAPLLMIGLFKIIFIFLPPILISKLSFDITQYYQYILSGIVVMISGMMGIVTGFLMIDERDGNISELISVTPLGQSGYLINRLSFAAFPAFIYSIAAPLILDLGTVPILNIFIISILSSIYSAIIGLLIYSGADNKVKALTYAKGLNSFALFAFSDLFLLRWLTVISWAFPPYWITMLVKNPQSVFIILIASVVHLLWFLFLIFRYLKSR